MTEEPIGKANKGPVEADEASPRHRALTPQAQRALAEAEARRQARDATVANRPRELHGRGGTEPARYGDWEVKGIASDF